MRRRRGGQKKGEKGRRVFLFFFRGEGTYMQFFVFKMSYVDDACVYVYVECFLKVFQP